MDFSLIVPSFNEEKNIESFLKQTTAVFDKQDFSYEIIVVDDGSSDNTISCLKNITKKGEFAQSGDIHVISFSRNFGKEAALYAGLEAAVGDCMGFIDADMQQRPETALELYNYLRTNPDCDCVAAVPKQRKEGPILKFFKNCFYKLFEASMSTPIIRNASDFRVFRSTVAKALLSCKESYRFSKGLFSWVGFHTHAIEYEPEKRLSGKSTWSFRKLLSYGFNGILDFSTFPLRMVFWVGMFSALIAVIYLIFVLIETASVGSAPSGYPTMVCLILLFGGIILISLGIVGDYLGRTYEEGKNRPIYIAREQFSVNLSDEDLQ